MEQKEVPTSKLFKVLSIDELSRRANTGGIEQYYRIKLQTKGGVIQTVDVDEKDFTPEKAKPILEAVAKNADAILSL